VLPKATYKNLVFKRLTKKIIQGVDCEKHFGNG
jgi:hypothetical protein